MRADLLAIIIISFYGLAYLFYSKFLAKKIFKLDNKNKTPAHEMEDGIDYVPTRKHILFGHHFASIAGAAPIVGPCIAVYWGWVPALIWVVLGNVVMGAVHDMGALLISVRHKAKSIGTIAGDIISTRAKFFFLLIIFFLIWVLSAAFAVIIARLFVSFPGSVVPINIAIVLALAIGFLIYRTNIKILIPSLIALILLYASIPLGLEFPVDLTSMLGYSEDGAVAFWVIYLMIYGFVASVLPVWVLLQPRDYINSHQLIVGLGILLLGIFVTQPEIVAPAFNLNATDSPPWFPFLFVTIACGAVSGAHGLIASGTTSKQINKETDIRPIGYGSMLIEGTLALLAIIAATAGFASKEKWHIHYKSWAYSSKHGLDAFVEGSASFLTNLNIPEELGAVFIAVIVISFAATTLDTTFRIQRFILAEIGEVIKIKTFSNRFISASIAVISVTILIFSDGAAGTKGAFKLWPLFGTSNQLLASITLLMITIYLWKEAKTKGTPKLGFVLTLIPTIFLTIMTLISNSLSIESFYKSGSLMLAAISASMLILQVLVTAEGFMVFLKK